MVLQLKNIIRYLTGEYLLSIFIKEVNLGGYTIVFSYKKILIPNNNLGAKHEVV